MAQRTLTISSGGKTFSATGWKVGWVHGSAELISAVKAVKQVMTFAASGPFQDAIAEGLGFPDEFFAAGAEDLQSRRDLLLAGLTEIGIPLRSQRGRTSSWPTSPALAVKMPLPSVGERHKSMAWSPCPSLRSASRLNTRHRWCDWPIASCQRPSAPG
ncbi:aminotransferase class I/II-fold pyridoxal phosphate-dependent enzyme [Ornithinimicrobium sp. INDO-MA30-4]|uniref:aminotransferase class I/II-fold pyridoxal phosphate-dependent enzyme n=1 Tax=Ornithinimicrobium sp. INDO-MA30-4 TaxID=2908651 RepID=UPI0028831BCF|nr:aminotransferase class I/II-fold pyridoxal phosphate-dependent enzyme [Ornithinimicrobium sp. INDO-MA30-4]